MTKTNAIIGHCIGTQVESVAEFGYKQIIVNYFESCHRKGPQYAAGGLLKNQADIAVIRGQFRIRPAVELLTINNTTVICVQSKNF